MKPPPFVVPLAAGSVSFHVSSVITAIQTSGRFRFRKNSALADYAIERNPREFTLVELDEKFRCTLSRGIRPEVHENASNLADVSNELHNQKQKLWRCTRYS
jgi:hypothetical protein